MTNRRDFLKLACGAAGFAAFEQGLDRFGLLAHAASAAPPNQYRALVCIFMFGGNDANNMVIPVDAGGNTGYNKYAQSRGASLALPALGATAFLNALPSTGQRFGLHPAMPELKTLFDQGKLAVVPNVGPLTRPTTKAQYQSNAAYRPYQLFSHSDQQSSWMAPQSDAKSIYGWGGRVIDMVSDLNTGTSFPASISLQGNNQFNVGQTQKALNVAPAPTALNAIFPLNGFAANAIDNARKTAFNSLRTFDAGVPLVKAASDITQQGLDIQASLSQDPVVGAFPATGLGNQLKQVAKIIKQNQVSLNVSRQVFFCSIGGFDTHQDELAAHTNLYTQISKAMGAFYTELTAQNLAANVTTFTMSDFGRTMAPSGSGTSVGSDHAWGSHQLVMGGAIKAADFYGTPGLNGAAFPDLVLGTAYDTDNRGRWIPSTAVDQYASTLGLWLGATPAELNTVFPNLYRFPTNDLGFLNP
ncbi:MAG: DUF1501 domain-containing protein [Acidobacteriota bacterium]